MSTTTVPAPPASLLTHAPDLTREFPRSPGKDIAGYVLLARAIDKCRATLAGRNGEYRYNGPLDRRFFEFTGVNADEMKDYIATGASDEEIGKWVRERDHRNSDQDILAWSYDQRTRSPQDAEDKAHFEQMRRDKVPERHNLRAWFELLDAEEGRI